MNLLSSCVSDCFMLLLSSTLNLCILMYAVRDKLRSHTPLPAYDLKEEEEEGEEENKEEDQQQEEKEQEGQEEPEQEQEQKQQKQEESKHIKI